MLRGIRMKTTTKLWKCISLFVLLLSIDLIAQNTLQPGIIDSSLSGSAGGAGTNGISFAMPTNIALLSWQVSFVSTPASDTILLQGAFDNSTWFTLDTSTNTAGEIRTVQSAVPFVRCNINAKSGGGNTTCSFSIKVVQGFGGTGNSPSILFGDGTLSSPSIAFNNQPGFGFFRNGTSILGLSGGASALPIIQFGGTDATFPALRRDASGLDVITADQSAFSVINVSFLGFGPNRGFFGSTANKLVQINDTANATGTELSHGSPTLGTCVGGSMTSGSHNVAGEVTATTGGSCVITFGAPVFTNPPFCVVTDETTTPTALQLSNRASGTITVANITSGHAFTWVCLGRIGT